MAGHPFSTGSSSSSANPDLISTPTRNSAVPPSVFYSESAGNRPVTPPKNGSNPTSTPISNKTSGRYTYASEIHDRDSANYRLALETSGHFLGPMPPKQFLDKFLPISQDAPKCPNWTGAFASVGNLGKEVNMYAPFIAAVTPFAPKLKFIDTHANPDMQCDKLAPDISIYPINDQPQGSTKTDFSRMDLFVEFKVASASDPFRDPEDPRLPKVGDFRFENDSDDAHLVRGQLVSYAAAHAGSQFRIHNFCVLVCGEHARFIRWDRDGAVVTRRFNYIKQPHLLLCFFWHYNHLDRRQQGYDTSVSSLTPENVQQIQHFESRLRDNNPGHREFRVLMVPDRDKPEVEKRFVVSFPPEYTARSPFGRATRSMLAFDIEAGKVVFLKDYWRADVDGMVKEGEIYALLESHRVPNIAPFGKGNDVRDHATLTHSLRDEKWACWTRDMILLKQYRMSLDVIARPLTSFHCSREFVSAIADAMEAHQHAYFDAHVLHRDISAGNILITYEGQGLLIDWDLSVKLIDSKISNQLSSARRPDRTGTWQFMSAALLQDNMKYNTLEDDRESSLHVLTWTALRFSKHTCSKGGSSGFLRAFDEEYETVDGVKGGALKKGFLLGRDISRTVKFDRRPQLDALIEELTEAFAARYEKPPTPDQLDVLKQMQSSNLPSSFLENNTTFKYQKRLDDLISPSWLVNTFRRHLEADSWPPSDEAQGQSISTGSGKKRARDDGRLKLRIPGMKSQKLSDGSGSRSGSRVPSIDGQGASPK